MSFTLCRSGDTLRIQFVQRLRPQSWLLYGCLFTLLVVWALTRFLPLQLFVLLTVWEAFAIASAWTYSETLVLDADNLTLERSVLRWIKWSHRTTIADIERFAAEQEPQASLLLLSRYMYQPGLHALAVRTRWGVRRAGPGLTNDEAREVASVVNAQLAEVRTSG
jgi:hypothetical protein